MLTDRLCNATGKDVKFNWHRGINIIIPADSSIQLTVEQMDDFRSGKPGSEEVLKQLQYHGLFLLDGDKSYESQALEILNSCLREKKGQLDAFVNRLRDSRIAAGSPVDEAALNEAKTQAGYNIIEKDIESIRKRISILEGVVAEQSTKGQVKKTLDPKRTCFLTQPPREFPSETALELFLSDQEPDFVAKHKALQAEMIGEESAA